MPTQNQSSMGTYVNEQVVDVPTRILNKGPEYLRSRMMNRDSALLRHNRRSAVELLAESKPLYVRSPDFSQQTIQQRNHDNSRLQASSRPGESAVLRKRSEGSNRDRGYTATACSGDVWDTQNHSKVTLQSISSPHQDLSIDDKGSGHIIHSAQITNNRVENSLDYNTGSLRSPAVTINRTKSDSQDSHLRHSSGKLIVDTEDVGGATLSERNTTPKQLPAWCQAGMQPDMPPPLPPRSTDHVDNSPVENRNSKVKYLHDKRPRYQVVKDMDIKQSHPHNKVQPKRPAPDIPTISTEEWRDTRTSSEVDQQSSHSSSQIVENTTVVRRRPDKTPISRSRSDLTKRFSNSSDFSELTARFNRNSADLEKFFSQMGLDHSVLEPLKLGQCGQAQSSSSLNLFESVSCLGSTDARSCFSEDSMRSDGRLKPRDAEERTPGSVVERNARIIKWLCNIKVASSTPLLPQHHSNAD